MKLTAPLHVLKRKAKELKRSQSITMVEALDQIAKAEGFNSWSLLHSKATSFVPKTQEDVLDYLFPGDLLLIGARPGLGKTNLALQLLLLARKEDRPCFFFSLEYTRNEALQKLRELDGSFDHRETSLNLDFSDAISADYIINKTKSSLQVGSLIAIDYLQLLDQQRNKPPLQTQIENLKAYAKEKGCILIFISQIDRAFEQEDRERPSLTDVRLPNPLNLRLFNKTIFVQNNKIHYSK